MRWVAWTALSAFPVIILEKILLLSKEKSLEGHSNLTFSFSERSSLMDLATVYFPKPGLGCNLSSRETKFRENKNIGSFRDRNGLHGVVRSIEVGHRVFLLLGIMSLT